MSSQINSGPWIGDPPVPTCTSSRLPWRRQRVYGGLPILPRQPGRGTVSAARFALFFTAVAWLAYVVEQSIRLERSGFSAGTVAETTAYLVIVTMLTGSAVAYLLARLGHFERARNHQRVPRSTIDDFFDTTMPTMSVIVPSYREDERIIRQTLLSAALQEYPNLRVVLLVDDPPNPTEFEHQQSLKRARNLPRVLNDYLRVPRQQFEKALEAFEHEVTNDLSASRQALDTLASTYDSAVRWFEIERARFPVEDHSDEFLRLEIFDRLANDLRSTALQSAPQLSSLRQPSAVCVFTSSIRGWCAFSRPRFPASNASSTPRFPTKPTRQ